MTKSYKQIFMTLPQEEPSPQLATGIMLRVRQNEVRRLRLKVVGHGLLAIATIVAFPTVTSSLLTALGQSGFLNYLSLVISDWSYTLGHLSDWILSVVSSWPVPGTIAFLGLLLVLINSLHRIARNLGNVSNLGNRKFVPSN